MKSIIQEKVKFYVSKLDSDQIENALHSLMETPSDAIPFLIDEFYNSKEPTSIKVLIIYAVWQHRDSSTLPFLIELLGYSSQEIWQEALNGIVTIGGQKALFSLRKLVDINDKEKALWINEAIEGLLEKNA